jgi:hypothetical protein
MAKMTAIIQQVAMVIKALFRVDLGKKGFTIARYLDTRMQTEKKLNSSFSCRHNNRQAT